MAVLALDAGTTKICALVMDEESGDVLETQSADNAFLPASRPWNRIQDPEKIFSAAENLVSVLVKKYGAFRCIGITGQMHGILYVDSFGGARSPLYTWQDMSANGIMENGETFAARLTKLSGRHIAPGYGIATWFYHHKTGQIPPGAAKICTIGDYIAMRLSSSRTPLAHSTNAGGMGLYDFKRNSFDKTNLERAGLDTSLLPEVFLDGKIAGEYSGGIPVCVSVGDNQAAFLGSVADSEDSILVNIGTGSQISFLGTDIGTEIENSNPLEARPFFDGRFLMAGASLCGGRSYAILENFFRQVIEMAGPPAGLEAGTSGGKPSGFSLYDAMDALAEKTGESLLTVNTLFAGTRADPSLKGSILNITEDNFTPAQFVAGFLHGAARELYDFYLPYKSGKKLRRRLVGAGNGIRKSGPLKKVLSRTFGMPLEIPLYREEAAYGAALFALSCTGYFRNVFEAQRLVKYGEVLDYGNF